MTTFECTCGPATWQKIPAQPGYAVTFASGSGEEKKAITTLPVIAWACFDGDPLIVGRHGLMTPDMFKNVYKLPGASWWFVHTVKTRQAS